MKGYDGHVGLRDSSSGHPGADTGEFLIYAGPGRACFKNIGPVWMFKIKSAGTENGHI